MIHEHRATKLIVWYYVVGM